MSSNIDNILSGSLSTIFVIHNIGETNSKKKHVKANYTSREKIINSNGLLTFDGCYSSVWDNKDILNGRDFILFIMEDFIGKDNSFDKGMPLERFCTWEQLKDLIDIGGTLGWHTNNHFDLTKKQNDIVKEEITSSFPTKYFSYPHGKFDNRVIELVKESGYKYAFGAGHRFGKGNFRIKRDYL